MCTLNNVCVYLLGFQELLSYISELTQKSHFNHNYDLEVERDASWKLVVTDLQCYMNVLLQ